MNFLLLMARVLMARVRPGGRSPPLLTAFWSAAGGSGTSVLVAACAVVLARSHHAADPTGVRVADLAGDLPAVFGMAHDPEVGLVDWLAAGPAAPTEALDRLLSEVAPGVALLPRGGGRSSPPASEPSMSPPDGACGAALAVALAQGASPVLVDCGVARDPAAQGVVEVADVALLVVRPCYLALRRAVHAPSLRHSAGVVVLDEPGRSLAANQIGEVLDLPVIARIPVKAPIARAVDAGVLTTRLPEPLARVATDITRRIGLASGRRGEAA